MKLKKVIISSLPTIFFLFGIIFLHYSPLTLSKTISMQNDVFILFYQELGKTNLASALILAFEYLWTNVLWIVLVFLVLISLGFIVYVFIVKKVDFRVVLVTQIISIFLIFFLTDFSITMLLTALSLFLGVLWMRETFELGKNDFTTGYHAITSRIGLMSVFLAIGIFVTIFLNPVYEQKMYESNMELLRNFIPDMGGVKEAQKDQIAQITEGFQYALTERYNTMSDDEKTQCKSMYDGLMVGLENYKERAFQKIDEEELGITEEDVMQVFPFFSVFTKITPLIVAITAYALLAVLTPFMGIFSGIIYSLARKMKVK